MQVDTLSNVVPPAMEKKRDIDEPGAVDAVPLADVGYFPLPLLDMAAVETEVKTEVDSGTPLVLDMEF